MDNFNAIFRKGIAVFALICIITAGGCASSPLLRSSCHIQDTNGDGILDANESAKMLVSITNEGESRAEDVSIRVSGFKEHYLGDIPSGQKRSVSFPITIPHDVQDGTQSFQITVTEKRGNNPEPFRKDVRVKGSRPFLRTSCQINDANRDGVLDAGESVTLLVSVANEGKGNAEDVIIRIPGLKKQQVGDIPAGHTKSATFSMSVADNVQDSTTTLVVNVTERKGNHPQPLQKAVRLRAYRPSESLSQKATVKDAARNTPSSAKVQSRSSGTTSKPPVAKAPKKTPQTTTARKSEETPRTTTARKSEETPQTTTARKNADAPQSIQETHAIATARRIDSYDAYKQFLQEWPDSKWAPEAKKRATPTYWKEQLAHKQSAHNYCQLAEALVAERGELSYPEAEECYTRAIQLDRNMKLAYTWLGKRLFETKRYHELIALFEQAPSQSKNYASFYYLARAHENLGNCKKAIESYNKALQLQPNSYQCLYDRAYLYWQQGRFGEAKEDFKKVVELKPTSILGKIAREYLKK